VLTLWAEHPADTMSVRALVQKADAAQAAIHYHFGDLERLYARASQVAVERAEALMAARLAALAVVDGADLPAALQASLLAGAIADWTVSARRLAMAERYAPGAQWQAAQDRHWRAFAARIGLAPHAAAIACFAAGEAARHLLVWNPALDRALLEETAMALVLWLRGRSFGADAIRAHHQALALAGYARPPQHRDALLAQIEQAAAALLSEKGHAGVTYRAVAGRAGVTLGKVIHLFGSKSELLGAALHRLYEREALGDDREGFIAQSLAPEVVMALLVEAIIAGDQPVLRAYDEIERAIYNGAEYAPLRGVVRSMEDPSGTWALRQLLGGAEPPSTLVAAFSAIIRGIGYRAAYAGMAREDVVALAEAALCAFRFAGD
jgi:AcrR family transcriptional regulator